MKRKICYAADISPRKSQKPTTISVNCLTNSHALSQEDQISKLVGSRSELLQYDPEKTLLTSLYFSGLLQDSRRGLAATLSYNPQLLTRSLEKRIASAYDFLRSLLSQKNVVSVFKSGSWIFVEGHSKKVAPNIEVLRESGMPQSFVSPLMLQSPGVFMLKPKDLGQLADEIKQIGFNLLKSMSLETIRALCGNNRSIRNRNRQVYKRWGWSEDDVLSALRRRPRCMTVGRFSEKDGMAWPSAMIGNGWQWCSVVKVLLLKGLMQIENVSLLSVLVLSDKFFLERFVARFIDEVPPLRVEVQEGLDNNSCIGLTHMSFLYLTARDCSEPIYR
ncbi:uncharacterized protein LOC125470748 [Pyrus x bretschneideri]|uniref:uncharacterized protein LOC125470748 n=1 Tax=Pyrus x bretschneideri TaxID=225117 RepID=UPI00202EBE7C|nr:uncharacterized protein LOC125470748 [Pyrus x bretschneideri]